MSFNTYNKARPNDSLIFKISVLWASDACPSMGAPTWLLAKSSTIFSPNSMSKIDTHIDKLPLVPRPMCGMQEKDWWHLAGFPACAVSAYYVNDYFLTGCIQLHVIGRLSGKSLPSSDQQQFIKWLHSFTCYRIKFCVEIDNRPMVFVCLKSLLLTQHIQECCQVSLGPFLCFTHVGLGTRLLVPNGQW